MSVSKSDDCDAETKVDSVIKTQIQEMLQKIPRISHQKANQTAESTLFDLQYAEKLFYLLQKKNILGDGKYCTVLAANLAVNRSSNFMMDKMLKIQFKAMNLNDISYEEYCRSYFKAKRIIDEEKSMDILFRSQLKALIEGVSQTEPREKNKKKKSKNVLLKKKKKSTDLEREWLKKARAREIKKSEKETLKDLCW